MEHDPLLRGNKSATSTVSGLL